ncbi:MAG: hypothetical protein KAR16_13910 [Bacteroidales bacterium]|nr:hypothetical protein [Bacteroidales bacterium]
MRRFVLLVFLGSMMPAVLVAQLTFGELVDRSFGSDQVLVNGIQFSNQYIRIDGNPYFMEGRFRTGSLCINDQCYEQVRLRYNLSTQKVEIEYQTPRGHLNQLITVPEQMPAFSLEGYEFRRMQLGEDAPAYYMVLTSGSTNCYVGWTKDVLGGGSSQESFSLPLRKYWIQLGQEWTTFDDRRTYVRAFPRERQKEFRDLLKKEKFLFYQATILETADMVLATIRLYEEGEGP